MKKCYECGKKLSVWEGYHHPILGNKALVCSKCFDNLNKYVDKYRNYILKLIEQGKEKNIFNNSNIKIKKIMKFFENKV